MQSATDSNKSRIEALDLLRFFAFVMVIFYHFLFIGPLQGFWPKDLRVDAFYYGDFGVDLFFMISGFVITLSSTNRTPFQFFKARFNRIVPTFVVCALIVLVFSCTLPMVDSTERIKSLVYSLTFFPKLFGKDYFSSIYWTLSVEITFYLWVFFFIATGWWKNHRDTICLCWALISLANNGLFHSDMLSQLLITEYSGHFIAGIIIFQLRSELFKPMYALLLSLSVALIFTRMRGFVSWISGAFGVPLSDVSILIAIACLLSLLWWASKVERLPIRSSHAQFLGAMSYPLYLIHTDLGFWSHAIFERTLFGRYPVTKEIFTYPVMMILAAVLSFVLAAFVVKITDPLGYKIMSKVWALFPKRAVQPAT